MKKSDLEELDEFKDEIRESESKFSELKGEKNAVESRLDDEYNLKPDKIKSRRSQIQKEVDKKETKFDGVMEKLREAFKE